MARPRSTNGSYSRTLASSSKLWALEKKLVAELRPRTVPLTIWCRNSNKRRLEERCVFFRHGRRNAPESANIQGTSKLTHNFHFKIQRKYNRQQKASVQSDDATVPSINDLAPGVFESFMTDLLGEEEGRQHAEKATDNETDFWGEIFSDNWAAMGGIEDDLTVPDYDQQVPNF